MVERTALLTWDTKQDAYARHRQRCHGHSTAGSDLDQNVQTQGRPDHALFGTIRTARCPITRGLTVAKRVPEVPLVGTR
jgi:hypothetical protein